MENLVSRGIELVVFGMGTVFVFLTLLILATQGMSWLVRRYEPEPAPRQSGAPAVPGARLPLAAIISAALVRHRNRRGPGAVD